MSFGPVSTATILLIAPLKARRVLLAQQLDVLGYNVVAVESPAAIASAAQFGQYDLLIADVQDADAEQAQRVIDEASRRLAHGTPTLLLNAGQASRSEAWTQDVLGARVLAALRHRDVQDVLAERVERFDGLNILDPETLLFSRRYFDAIWSMEVERARRIHQPLSLLLLHCDAPVELLAQAWRAISATLLTGLRQTDLLVRYDEAVVLAALPATEAPMARAVALRLVKALDQITVTPDQPLPVMVGLAAYPQHGTVPDQLVAAALQALHHATRPGVVVSRDQI